MNYCCFGSRFWHFFFGRVPLDYCFISGLTVLFWNQIDHLSRYCWLIDNLASHIVSFLLSNPSPYGAYKFFQKWIPDIFRQNDSIPKTSNNQRLKSTGDNDRRFLLQHCPLHKFHMTDGQNMHDQITSDQRSKCVRPKCVMCIPFILSGSPHEYWLHICDTCIIKTWRLGLRPHIDLVDSKASTMYCHIQISHFWHMYCDSIFPWFKFVLFVSNSLSYITIPQNKRK